MENKKSIWLVTLEKPVTFKRNTIEVSAPEHFTGEQVEMAVIRNLNKAGNDKNVLYAIKKQFT
ncbi:hypothetical protein D3C81_519950 [compost metagenome]